MASATGGNATVVSVLKARANFGKLLDDVEQERRSLVIEKRGTPRAVLLSLGDYVKMAAPEPEAQRKGSSALSSREIDQAIGKTRAAKKKRA
jgi:prevent-host-death family protein